MNLERVDLNLLTYLDVLLREKNVTRAAEQLGVTQPAMSNILRRLRTLFNDPLLIRSSEGMTPTERALELQPSFVLALTNLGETLLLADRPGDALAPLMRALEVSPRDPTRGFTWYRLGRAHLLLGNAREALAWWACIEPPNYNPAMVALWQAAAWIAMGEVQRGAEWYRQWRPAIAEGFSWTPPGSRAYVQQWQRCVLEPLRACGAEPDGTPFEPWLARSAAAWVAGV